MNKTELIAAVAAAAEISKKDAAAAVDATFDAITAAIAKGDKVQVIGFGTFECRERAAREGLNPQTKEKVQIDACKVPAFKAGKGFKDIVNQ